MVRSRKPADSDPAEGLLRISAAAKAAGVRPQAIEYYIMLGLVKPVRRPERTGRYFDARTVRRIRLIRELNQTGYTLRAIREIYMARR